MAPADRLAARRPGRRHPLAGGDGAEDAAEVSVLVLPSDHVAAVENETIELLPVGSDDLLGVF